MLCRLSYCPAFGDREVSFASSRIRENSGHRAMHPNSHESGYNEDPSAGHKKKPGVCDTGLRKGFRTRPRVTGASVDWKKNR